MPTTAIIMLSTQIETVGNSKLEISD